MLGNVRQIRELKIGVRLEMITFLAQVTLTIIGHEVTNFFHQSPWPKPDIVRKSRVNEWGIRFWFGVIRRKSRGILIVHVN